MNSKKISLIVLTAMIVFFLAVMPVSAQKDTLTQLTFNTASSQHPSISADGSKIAFHSEVDVDDDREIFVINSDGTGLTQLTFNTANTAYDGYPFNTAYDEHPSISGDGSKIAFYSDVDGDCEIFVINSDGTGLTQLTFNTAYDDKPSISGDGSKIAFESSVDGDWEIFVINSDGTGLTQLTFNTAYDDKPSISGDGSKIAFESSVDGDWEIFVINSDGTGLTQLSSGGGHGDPPSISGDGSKIAFDDGAICVINSDGTGLTQLTSGSYPSISSDGSKIAFHSYVDGNSEILVINSDGTGLTQLTSNTTAIDRVPSISGDGSKIAFQSDSDIFVVSYTPPPTIESTNISGTKKDIFQPGESVYAKGRGYPPGRTYHVAYELYVVNDTIWTDGMTIPGRVSGTATSVTTGLKKGIIPAGTLIWASSRSGKYDIVIDVDGDGCYDVRTDALDDMDVEGAAGFKTTKVLGFTTILIEKIEKYNHLIDRTLRNLKDKLIELTPKNWIRKTSR